MMVLWKRDCPDGGEDAQSASQPWDDNEPRHPSISNSQNEAEFHGFTYNNTDIMGDITRTIGMRTDGRQAGTVFGGRFHSDGGSQFMGNSFSTNGAPIYFDSSSGAFSS